MAGPVLTVAVTADVTDLQTKLAAARAAYNASSNELRKMAADAQKAGQDLSASLNPAVAKAAAETAGWKAQVTALASELSSKLTPAVTTTTNAHKNMNGVIGQNRVAFNELTHTVRAVADGLAAGINPMTLFSEEFFRVSQALTEFNTVSAGTIAKFGAIGAAAVVAAGGVFLFARRMMEARDSASLALNLRISGIDISGEQVEHYKRVLLEAGYTTKELGSLTSDEVDKIMRKWAAVPHANDALIKGMADVLPGFAERLGKNADEAAADMATMLTSADAARRAFLELDKSGKTLLAFNGADEDPVKQRAIALQFMAEQSRLASTNAVSGNVNTLSPVAAIMGPTDASNTSIQFLSNLAGISDLTSARIKDATDKSAEAQKLFAESIKNTVKLAPDLGVIQDKLEKIAQNPKLLPSQVLSEQVELLRGLKGLTDDPAITKLFDAHAAELVKTQSEDALASIRQRALQAGAQAQADRKDQQAAELEVYRQAANDKSTVDKLTAVGKRQLDEETSSLEIRYNRSAATEAKKDAQEVWREYKATMDQRLAEAKGNSAEQLKILGDAEKEAIKLFGGEKEAYKAIKKEEAEITHEQAQQALRDLQAQIAGQKDIGEIQANMAKLGAHSDKGEFKPSIGLVFDTSDMQAKVAAQVAAIKAELNADFKGETLAIQAEIKLGTPEDMQKALSDMKTLSAEMAAFGQQAQDVNEKAAAAVQASWEKITGPVGNAFDKMVDAALSGGRNMRVEMLNAAGSIVEGWAKAGIKMVTDWAASELRKLFISQSTAAAQTALLAPQQAAEFASLARSLGFTVTTEAQKTTAVATGAETQAAVKQAAQAQGTAVEAAAASKSILGSAYKAAAATYASIAEIPIVGPILAPFAAAGAFAAVAAYDVVSAEGGYDRVTKDNQPALLHKNEMVLPAHLAEGVRNMVSAIPTGSNPALGGTASTVNSSGDVSHNVTINHSPTINAPGGSGTSATMAEALRQGRTDLYSTMQSWYANGALTLPGRTPWR